MSSLCKKLKRCTWPVWIRWPALQVPAFELHFGGFWEFKRQRTGDAVAQSKTCDKSELPRRSSVVRSQLDVRFGETLFETDRSRFRTLTRFWKQFSHTFWWSRKRRSKNTDACTTQKKQNPKQTSDLSQNQKQATMSWTALLEWSIMMTKTSSKHIQCIKDLTRMWSLASSMQSTRESSIYWLSMTSIQLSKKREIFSNRMRREKFSGRISKVVGRKEAEPRVFLRENESIHVHKLWHFR